MHGILRARHRPRLRSFSGRARNMGIWPMGQQGETRQCCEFCARCGQAMFEYFRSPDGHFGMVSRPPSPEGDKAKEITCPTCGTLYILLDRLDAQGRPVRRAGGNPELGPRKRTLGGLR